MMRTKPGLKETICPPAKDKADTVNTKSNTTQVDGGGGGEVDAVRLQFYNFFFFLHLNENK